MIVNNIGLVNGEGFEAPACSIDAEKGILKLTLQGEQETYNTNKSVEGTIIEIDAEFTVDILTPSMQDKIQVYVINENVVMYENEQDGKGYNEVAIEYGAMPGMITLNKISGYNGEESVTSITTEEALGKMPINSPAKNAKIELTVINNSGDTCENVSVLGRLPFTGNKDFVGNELGSNITLKLVSGITAVSGINAENVKVYYSTDAEATKESISWTDTIEDLSNVKSYLIVLENYQMPQGARIDFTYNVEIPANLKHDQTAYTIYNVSFNQETKTSAKVGLSTMPGPELNVNFKANVENGQEVQEGDIITYSVEVTNTGKVDATNVKVSGIIPEGTVGVIEREGEGATNSPSSYEELDISVYEITFDSIKIGETKTVSYMVKVNGLQEAIEELEIIADATITVIDSGDVYTTNKIQNKANKGHISIKYNTNELVKEAAENSEVTLKVYITNVTEVEKTNVKATYKLPEGMEFIEATANFAGEDEASKIVYNKEINTLTYNIGTMQQGRYATLEVQLKIKPLAENETEKQLVNIFEVTCEQTTDVLKSEEVIYNVAKPKLEVKQTSDIAPGNIDVGDKVIYTIEVKNTGKGIATDVNIVDYIPGGLRYISTKYVVGEKTLTYKIGSNTTSAKLDIPAGETAYVTVEVEAQALENGQKTKEVTNVVKVSSETIAEIEANTITHIINAQNSILPEEDENEEVSDTYKITGSVWQDDNENGNREDGENILSGINVLLIDTKTASKISETTTNISGRYEFPNLQPGRYIVVFMYNNQEYMVTTYQAQGVNESRNSDAIDHTILVDGEKIIGAVTNNINLTSASSYNIDLGLVLRNKFDLSLNKSINKITVTTTKGTENYTYDEGETLAKVDIAPKRIEGANVVVEYKITVTNNGTVSGFVSKVVDYIPDEFKFSSNLNPDWYEAEDGNIYSSVLSDTELKPGETREVSLVLTKTMTGENTGMVHNTAEIYEAYNEFGIEDMNSTPANKIQNENDMGSADVLLTVNTGEPAMYITLTIAMLALFTAGAYLINKKVIRK